MSNRVLSHYRFSPFFGWLRRITSSRRKAISTVRKMYKKFGLLERNCTICDSKDFVLLSESDRYGFDLKKQICQSCGLVQTMPSLKPEFLDKFYSQYYRRLYTKRIHVNYDALIEEQTAKGHRFREYFVQQELSDVLPNLAIIEIGCSSSGILAALAPNVRSVQGCDLDVEAIAHGKQRYGFELEVSALPTHLPKSPRMFILSHVLEHLADPLEALRNIRDLMGQEDYLFIEVPGMNTVAEGNYGYDLWAYFHIAHVSDFTAGTINVLAAQAGLQVLSCDETVTALLRRADLTVLPWTKNPKDSVENVLRIEATFRNKKKSFEISKL